MPPRLWQRQPDETPADFTAFVAYLRLKGRRSHRAAAEQTGRSLVAIRRLSARHHWTGRVAAFETRLADATQAALDHVIQSAITTSQSDLEQFRIKEFLLAHQVIHESKRWLKLASDPRRHQISILQICRLTELAFKLQCLATGMPFGEESKRRKRREDVPGYWTGPSAEAALEKIYGDQSPAAASLAAAAAAPAPAPATTVASAPPDQSPRAAGQVNPSPGTSESASPNPSSATEEPPPVIAPEYRRRDVWSAWSRHQRTGQF